MSGAIRAVNHTGLTVRDLDAALAFWHGALGFPVVHRAILTGPLASGVTGVVDAEIMVAVVQAPGHRIELLHYIDPPGRPGPSQRPNDVGAAHLALEIDDLESVLATAAAHGFVAAGAPHVIPSGPNAGLRVVYVRDPDGTTIELMQPGL